MQRQQHGSRFIGQHRRPVVNFHHAPRGADSPLREENTVLIMLHLRDQPSDGKGIGWINRPALHQKKNGAQPLPIAGDKKIDGKQRRLGHKKRHQHGIQNGYVIGQYQHSFARRMVVLHPANLHAEEQAQNPPPQCV